MKVIINADDLGKSLEVNHAIENCIKEELITSSTIMAVGDAFDDAIRIAKSYPQISFGVHLTIDDGDMSLTKAPIFVKEGITDSEGRFIRYGIKNVKKYSSELKDAIYKEWTAQIQKVKSAGVSISHVDSHHHNHTILSLKDILIKVLRDNGINRVRLSQTKTPSMYWHRVFIVHPIKKQESVVNKHRIKSYKESKLHVVLDILRRFVWTAEMKRNFKTTDYFCSYATFLKNKETLHFFFKNRILELMCHPGHPDYMEETEELMKLPKEILKINYCKL